MDLQVKRQGLVLELQSVDDKHKAMSQELGGLEKRGDFLRGAIAMCNELLGEKPEAGMEPPQVEPAMATCTGSGQNSGWPESRASLPPSMTAV